MAQSGAAAIVAGAGPGARGAVALWDVQEARAKDVLARIHGGGGGRCGRAWPREGRDGWPLMAVDGGRGAAQ